MNSPPKAASMPEMAKTLIRILFTLIPARRAASALPPTAKICRPYVVRRTTKSAMTSTARNSTRASGRPRAPAGSFRT